MNRFTYYRTNIPTQMKKLNTVSIPEAPLPPHSPPWSHALSPPHSCTCVLDGSWYTRAVRSLGQQFSIVVQLLEEGRILGPLGISRSIQRVHKVKTIFVIVLRGYLPFTLLGRSEKCGWVQDDMMKVVASNCTSSRIPHLHALNMPSSR